MKNMVRMTLAWVLAVVLALGGGSAFANVGTWDGTTNLGPAREYDFGDGLTVTGANQGKKTVAVAGAQTFTDATLTGNLAVGNGTPTVTMNGEDAYVEGTFEVDGATRLDGAATLTSTLAVSGASTLSGDVTGDGGDQLVGFLRNQVAATATTITAAQCGSTFINSGAIEMELPEASTVLGCELTFIVGNASNFTIDPDAADIIVLSTDAAGDSLIADAVGEVLVIEAINASTWAPKAQTGTWTDSN